MGRQLEEFARGKPRPLSFLQTPASLCGARRPGLVKGPAHPSLWLTRSCLPGLQPPDPGAGGGVGWGAGGGGALRGSSVARAVMSLASPNPRLAVLCFSSACS
jgi:hypothetical protein